MRNQNGSFNLSPKNTAIYRFIKKSGRELRHNVKKYFFVRSIKSTTPVFVFQMGKVASSSIYHSLRNNGFPSAVGHGHHIGPDNWQAQCLYEWANAGNPLNIISLIREPIGRNVSNFFQLHDEFTGVEYEKSELTLDQLKESFLENADHDTPLIWFDKNIKDIFGIDVYSYPFPPSGYISVSKDNINLLVMRFDLDDSIKQRLVSDFVGFPRYKLERENVSSNKNYYKTYKDFVNKVKLPNSYINKMCGSKYFRHFFSESEIQKVSEKWSGRHD